MIKDAAQGLPVQSGPDLQNVPLASPEGKRVRDMFRQVLSLDIDYGKLERHIAAQMTKPPR